MKHNYVKHRDNAGDLEYFISKFECRVTDSREYNQYMRGPNPYHRDFYDSDNFKVETKIVPMKAIHLTSDNLAKLVAEQEHMQRLHDNDAFHTRDDAAPFRQMLADLSPKFNQIGVLAIIKFLRCHVTATSGEIFPPNFVWETV